MMNLSTEQIGNMTRDELRVACHDLSVENYRAQLVKEIFELCGNGRLWTYDLEVIRDWVQQLVDFAVENDL